MGIYLGVILSIVGVGLSIIPLIITLDVRGNLKPQDTQANIDKYKKRLATAAWIIGISAVLVLISLILLWIYAERRGEKKGELAGETIELQTLQSQGVQIPTNSLTPQIIQQPTAVRVAQNLDVANEIAGIAVGTSAATSGRFGNLQALYEKYIKSGNIRKAEQVAEEIGSDIASGAGTVAKVGETALESGVIPPV